MADQSFVLKIDPNAFEWEVQKVGNELLELKGYGVDGVGRDLEHVVADVCRGVADDLLLRTHLPRNELEEMLWRNFGRESKCCQIHWLSGGSES